LLTWCFTTITHSLKSDKCLHIYFFSGEEPYSYGYGGTGKYSKNSKFTTYGEPYGEGDVIGALLDLDAKPPSMSFTKNGKWLGVAESLSGFPVGVKERALYPHILSKNTK
jgi:heterogeneous nuclear ribonucleoprotein U-like protein 1